MFFTRKACVATGRRILKYYPLFFNITGKKCVVIGGGEVAARKVARLLDCAAEVYIVSPQLSPELVKLKTCNNIKHIADNYNARYLAGAVLIIGATDDEKTNAAISSDARNLGVPVNIVDDPQKCDFILPSVIERGDLTIAVSTGGKSPALARRLREELAKKYGGEYEILLKILGNMRRQLKNSETGNSWCDSLIESGILEAIAAGNWEKVKKTVKEITGEEVVLG